MSLPAPMTGYALVNGLQMYYEIHGAGQPLLLLHEAFMTINLLGNLLAELACTRQVIAAELQGHGRTADTSRAFSYEAVGMMSRPCWGTSRCSLNRLCRRIPATGVKAAKRDSCACQ